MAPVAALPVEKRALDSDHAIVFDQRECRFMVARYAVALLLATLLAIRGKSKKRLSGSGAVAAFAVGLLSFGVSYRFGWILILFYLSSSKLTKYKAHIKAKLEQDHEKESARGAEQVLCCSITGVVIAIYYAMELGEDANISAIVQEAPNTVTAVFLQAAYLVPRGTNGGMSVLGTGASAAGGVFIGACFWVLGVLCVGASLTDGMQAFNFITLGLFAGVFGSVLDSLLGATLQASWYSDTSQCIVGSPGPGCRHITGTDLLSNTMVNLVSAAITSGCTGALALVLMRD